MTENQSIGAEEKSMQGFFSYWLIAAFLLLWGSAYAGLVVFSFFIAGAEHWAQLVSEGRIKPEYVEYISRIPNWVILITVLAASTRLIAAIALLLRSRWAVLLYAISLCFVTVIMFRGFVLADITRVIRGSQIVLEFAFLGISVFAVWYSARRLGDGVLK